MKTTSTINLLTRIVGRFGKVIVTLASVPETTDCECTGTTSVRPALRAVSPLPHLCLALHISSPLLFLSSAARHENLRESARDVPRHTLAHPAPREPAPTRFRIEGLGFRI
jgi:hypothetical protein